MKILNNFRVFLIMITCFGCSIQLAHAAPSACDKVMRDFENFKYEGLTFTVESWKVVTKSKARKGCDIVKYFRNNISLVEAFLESYGNKICPASSSDPLICAPAKAAAANTGCTGETDSSKMQDKATKMCDTTCTNGSNVVLTDKANKACKKTYKCPGGALLSSTKECTPKPPVKQNTGG